MRESPGFLRPGGVPAGHDPGGGITPGRDRPDSRIPAASVSGLTSREREVLSMMAEGRSNAALVVSPGAVEKHVASIFAKLGLPPSESDNRRGLAVLHYLRSS